MELDEILTMLGYENNHESKKNTSGNYNKSDINVDDNIDDSMYKDIPGGFRELNPLLFITIGEVIGDIISGNLPFNTANSISNFLTLVGQIIETCGTQQQYFESGPGRYFDKNMNDAFYGNTNDDNYNTCINDNNMETSEQESISTDEIMSEVQKIQKEIEVISGQINLMNNDINMLKNHFK